MRASAANLVAIACLVVATLAGRTSSFAPGVPAQLRPPQAKATAHPREGGQECPPHDKTPLTDAHGDPLPPGAVARLGTVRWRQGARVEHLAFSPDGKQLVSFGGKSIYLWDVATGKRNRKIDLDAMVGAVCFSPDGKLLASGDYGCAIRLWDLASGKEVRRLEGHIGAVKTLAFSPDGRMLASGGEDQHRDFIDDGFRLSQIRRDADRTVRVWDVPTGKCLRELGGHESAVSWVQFVDDKQLLSAAADRHVRWWDTLTGRQLGSFAADAQGLRQCCVATKPKHLVGLFYPRAVVEPGQGLPLPPPVTFSTSPERRNSLCVWDVGAKEPRLPVHVRRTDAKAVAVSGNGEVLVLVGDDRISVYRSIKSEDRPQLILPATSIAHVALSPDGRLLAASDGGPLIRLWDLSNGEEVSPTFGPAGGVRLARLLPDGKNAVTADHSTLHVWDVAKGTARASLCLPRWSRLDLSQDGRRLVVADSGLAVVDVTTGKVLSRHRGFVPHRLCISADGTRVAGACPLETFRREAESTNIYVVEAATGKTLHKLIRHPIWPSTIAFMPDDKSLLINGAAVWDTNGSPSKLSASVGDFIGFVNGGRIIVAHGPEQGVDFWDRSADKLLHQFGAYCKADSSLHRLRRLANMPMVSALSPDGQFVALEPLSRASDSLELRSCPSGRLLGRLQGHDGEVNVVSFSPDGKYAITGSEDCTALVWDLAEVMKRHRERKADLSEAAMHKVWEQLGGQENPKINDAIDCLVAAPQTMPWLTQRLEPLSTDRIDAWIADLDSRKYAARRDASAVLESLEHAAKPALVKALASAPSEEARRRMEKLLEKLAAPMTNPSILRSWRSVVVLEQMGTAEARELLVALSRGAAEGELTRHAQAALRRLQGWP